MRAGMRSPWRDFVRIKPAETYDLRNNRGSFATVVGFLEYVPAKIHTLRIFSASLFRHFR
jgi:hypothetical protein